MKIVASLVLMLLLVGCESTKPIYYHGDYNNAVYQYLKNDELSVDQQIQMLITIIEQAENNGLPVLPGVHAHLGLLYFDSGNAALGEQHFDIEKSLFPESVPFLEFLISQSQQGSASNE